MQQIQALRFDVQEVGKHVKGSKKRYTWDFSLKDKPHTIVLDFSFISGKVKITVDRKVLHENELPSNVSFQYPFTLQGFAINIIQQGETFELRLNNKVFSHLYTQQKTNQQFKKYEDDVKDIKVSLNTLNPPNQKISLNIGAFGGMKKKKEKVGESAGWDAFSGGSFPNYFGDSGQKTEEKPAVQPPPKANLLDEEEKSETTVVSKPSDDLLGEAPQPPKQSDSSIFDLYQPPSQQTSSISINSKGQDFSQMQSMFSAMKVENQPASKQVDFFADEPKSEVAPSSSISVKQQKAVSSGFDLSFPPTNQNFATGFGFQPSNVSSKGFATSSPGGKSLQNDFFLASSKQPISLAAFSKKQSPSQISPSQQVDLAKQGTPKNNESHLTSLSVDDFLIQKKSSQKPQFQLPESFGQPTGSNIQPQSNDFSTMQLLFQTNNAKSSVSSQINNPNQVNASSMGFGFPVVTQNSNDNDFNTLQNMFKTTNYSNINPGQSQLNQPKAPPVDMFKNNKPQTFATSSGVAPVSFAFGMDAFGTNQVNIGKSSQMDFTFPEKKESGSGVGGGNLI